MGTFILRIVVGLLFVGHGLQKLTHRFGGGGIENTEKTMDALGMHPAKLQARTAALAETAGGAALALGAATPLASAGLIATMATAVRKVHAQNGIWNTKGGYEFNLVMAASALLLAERPGKASVDALFGRSKWGAGWAVFALVAGVIGSTLAIEAGRRLAPERAADEQSTGQKSTDEQSTDVGTGDSSSTASTDEGTSSTSGA